MKLRAIFAPLLISALVFTALSQQDASYSGADKEVELMPLTDVRAGQTGTAKTVFSGNEPKPFNVEILGILPNVIGPQQDLIVCRISGGEADRTQVFAGMSGAPVEINGKLVGAIAFAYPFAKEAICGITPIEQMISIFDGGEAGKSKRAPRSYSFAELAGTNWNPDYKTGLLSAPVVSSASNSPEVNSLAGQSFRKIATPLSLTGFSPAAIGQFSKELGNLGMMPVMGASGGSKIGPMKKADSRTLVGGDSVSVQLIRGDMAAAASGTVTLRKGNRVYAFGHPFLSLGSSSLPMTESSVVVVVPNINNSFKLAVAEDLVGSMTQDRATGVLGELGKAPAMIPVKLGLTTSRKKKRTYNLEVAHDELLTPLLLNMAISNAVVSQERNIGNTFVTMKAVMKMRGHENIEISGRYSGQLAARLATNQILLTSFNLVTSNFDDMRIDGIEIELESDDTNSSGILESIEIDKNRVKPGEEVNVYAYVRTNRGKVVSERIPFKVPADTPYGKLRLSVGDGNTIERSSANNQFTPNSLAELISKINRVKKGDRLYLVANRITNGAVIGSSELPNLPPSVRATIGTGKRSNSFSPTVESSVAEVEVPPAEFVVIGLQQLDIEVIPDTK